MSLNFIIEICVGIDIAVLGIAYPIIVDKISSIGEKYSSNYLLDVFYFELPQKYLRITKEKKISLFKIILYCTIFSFIFLIFPFKPLFGWDNYFINNSASLLVLLLTSILTVSFFWWLNNVVLFTGKSTTLLNHLIKRYNVNRGNDTYSTYYLKVINEITLYTVVKQDYHLQKSLLEFYNKEFALIRRSHPKGSPLIYPADLYFLIYNLNIEIVDNNNHRIRGIEHRAISAWWLFGEDIEEIAISDVTYGWIWRNLNVISEKPNLIRDYWGSAFRYFENRLRDIDSDYDYKTGKIINSEKQTIRKTERDDFLEMHFALGALMLYRSQYDSIKYFFDYTQSQPPRYVLLPNSMDDIFNWLKKFNDDFQYRQMSVDLKYNFSGLDNLGTSSKIIYHITTYLALLFVRMFSLNQYYIIQKFTSQIQLSKNIIELKRLLEIIPFFEKCLIDVVKNESLLEKTSLNRTIEEKKVHIFKYLSDLKENISKQIGIQKEIAPLSDIKIESFKKESGLIIGKTLEEYKKLNNSSPLPEPFDGLKLVVQGGNTLFRRAPFIDNGESHLNFDTVFASQLADNIKYYLPNSFGVAKTQTYLVPEGILTNAIDKIIGDNTDCAIIPMRLSHSIQILLKKYNEQIIDIAVSDHKIRDRIYILRKIHLPWIIPREIKSESISEKSLTKVNDEFKVYASVLEYKMTDTESPSEDFEPKVQLIIAFIQSVYWHQNRDVIQIDVFSKYEEKGVPNELNEIEPLKNEKNHETN